MIDRLLAADAGSVLASARSARSAARARADVSAVNAGGLHAFLRLAWPHMGLSAELRDLDAWHLRALCAELEAVQRRQCRRLVVCLPPGTTKTISICVTWPVWCWIRDGGVSDWVFTGYDITKLHQSARMRRTLISSSWFRARWGDRVRLNSDDRSRSRVERADGAGEFSTTSGGSSFCTTPRGRVTNRHFEYAVTDDSINALNAFSVAELSTVSQWYWGSMQTRTGDQSAYRQVVNAQRLAQGDLPGECLERGWRGLVLPMRYDPDVPHASLDRDPRTRRGELLVPARYPEAEVAALEDAMGRDAAAAQLQQHPRPPGGQKFERHWFRRWRSLPPRGGVLVDSWDLSGGGGTRAGSPVVDSRSWDVGQRWLLVGDAAYLLEEVRSRMGTAEQQAAVRALYDRPGPGGRRPAVVLLENKAAGPGVASVLRFASLVEPRGGKEARAGLVVPDAQNGRVYIPADAPWAEDWLDEVAAFPARPDDRVDAMSQALAWEGRPVARGANALLDLVRSA